MDRDLLILVLATYYVAITFTKLHGPYALTERLRHAVYRRRGYSPKVIPETLEVEWYRPRRRGEHYDEADPPLEKIGDDWVTEGVSCPHCTSLYIAATLSLIWALAPPLRPLVQILAIAGGSSLVFGLGRHW